MYIDRGLRAARAAQERDRDAFQLLVEMLAEAIRRHPQGLPDTELQRVFAAHRAAIRCCKS